MATRRQNARAAKLKEVSLGAVSLDKACTHAPYCAKCKCEGPRYDQMKCPLFRTLVNTERDKREPLWHTK